jgi:ATP-dependent 26S proteasome regulatory subunit
MAEELDKIINDLGDPYSNLYSKLLENIPNIYEYKLKLYRNKLAELNQRIIKVEQPKLITSLCAYGLWKDTIDYEANGQYYSYDITEGKIINSLTGEEYNIDNIDNYVKEVSEVNEPKEEPVRPRRRIITVDEKEKAQVKSAIKKKSRSPENVWLGDNVPESVRYLVNPITQCKGSPRSAVVRSAHPEDWESKGDAIIPTSEDLREQNRSYYQLIKNRNSLKGLINSIEQMIKSMELPTKIPNALHYSDYKVVEEITENGINAQIRNLRNSVVEFKLSILGESRKSIRNDISKIIRSFAQNWKLYTQQYINYALLGPPGTGKTEVAIRMGQVFKYLGILLIGNVITHSRATLIGQYVGQTADKVRSILDDCLESIVFIDEAYSLAQASGQETYDAYGVEGINEIVGYLDKHRGEISLFAAGYEKEMQKYWFGPNPGMLRRMPFQLILGNYNTDELFMILKTMVYNTVYNCSKLMDGSVLDSKLTGQVLYALLVKFYPYFNNQAGDMENLASAIMNLYYDKLSKNNKSKITAQDILEIFVQYAKLKADYFQDLTDVKSIKMANDLNKLLSSDIPASLQLIDNIPVSDIRNKDCGSYIG